MRRCVGARVRVCVCACVHVMSCAAPSLSLLCLCLCLCLCLGPLHPFLRLKPDNQDDMLYALILHMCSLDFCLQHVVVLPFASVTPHLGQRGTELSTAYGKTAQMNLTPKGKLEQLCFSADHGRREPRQST